LTESGTRLYSELEVNELIDDLTKAAHEEGVLSPGGAQGASRTRLPPYNLRHPRFQSTRSGLEV
jgi:hypothetical protein